MPRIVTVPLSLEQRAQLILLTKHAAHWRERQRAQTILWLSEGKTVAEVAALQERIPETIRLQRRHWELHQFESIQEVQGLIRQDFHDGCKPCNTRRCYQRLQDRLAYLNQA